MVQSRSFSIYLLKEKFHDSSALKDNNSLDKSIPASGLPDGATLYILDADPRPPWWKEYFGINKVLFQASKGAIVFLPVTTRVFAITFGHVAHNLKDESYEHDFGLKVTLNCVDPKKLRNTDTLEPGSSRRQRTQLAVATDLTYFDFDYDSAVLKSITGTVRDEYKELIQNATGSSNLRVSTKVNSRELVELCTRFLALYNDESYLEQFPNIQKIKPVRDPEYLDLLNGKLVEAFHQQEDGIYLTVPDIINYSDNVFSDFEGAGRSHNYADVSIENYYHYLKNNGVSPSSLSLDALKRHHLRLTNDDERPYQAYTIYKSLIFDTKISEKGAAYYLNEGNWYEVETSYVASLKARLDEHFSPLDELPACSAHLEKEYNLKVAEKDGFICLDQTSINPKGQANIEPCDVYTVENGKAILIHVKISTRSSQLSHLFNQGANSVEVLKTEPESREKLIKLIENSSKTDASDQMVEPILHGRHEVVFAIITAKPFEAKSDNLPLFSRISLARNIRSLHLLMGVPVRFGFIKDESVARDPQKKDRKKGTRK